MEASRSVAFEAEKETAALRLSILTRDVAKLGSSTLLVAIFGTLLVFLVPRLVSVEDFAYWRLFLLYAGYAGLLHMGSVDGALLRWAGKPLDEFHREIGPSLKFLSGQQVVMLVPAALLCLIWLPGAMRFVAVAVLSFALLYNVAALLQYSLQAARQFAPVAIATAAPAGTFVGLTLLWTLKAEPDFRILVGLYFLAWFLVLLYLWMRVKPRTTPSSGFAWSLGKELIGIGWPIVLANTGFGLVQSADRLVVSSAMSIYDFAQYSLAASSMVVPVTAIAAISRVFFPHIAAIEREDHGKTYRRASRFLFSLWSLLLPYYLILSIFVRHFLPKYLPSLPIAAILLLGLVFFGGIQILHTSFFSLYGWQKRFLIHSVAAIIMSFSLVILSAVYLHSLTAVAIAEILAAGLWWQFNEWRLREITEQGWGDWLRVLTVFGWSAISLLGALMCTKNSAFRAAIYYGLTITFLVFVCPSELRRCWGITIDGGARLFGLGRRIGG